MAGLPDANGVTRRRLLQVGGIGGAALLLGVRPWSPASASAAGSRDYLLRSSYENLTTPEFAMSGGGTAQLLRVSDLVGGKQLAGSEDAFALEFSSSRPLDQGMQTLSHPELGRFDLFMAPDAPLGTRSSFSVVVNRSVGATPRPPKPPASRSAQSAKTPQSEQRHEVVRRIALRRSRKGLVCDVQLDPGERVEHVSVWLMRGDRLVASATRKPHGHHAVLRLRTKRRARRGAYTVAVVAGGPHGAQYGRRKSVALR
jgi:hypothetical protein